MPIYLTRTGRWLHAAATFFDDSPYAGIAMLVVLLLAVGVLVVVLVEL